MHDILIQIKLRKEDVPIQNAGDIWAELEHSFLYHGIDYLSDLRNGWSMGTVVGALEKFIEILPDNPNAFKFNKDAVESYFEKRLNNLKKYVSALTLAQYKKYNWMRPGVIHDNDHSMYVLYIDSWRENEILTFDNFLRKIDVDEEYEVINAFDYHS